MRKLVHALYSLIKLASILSFYLYTCALIMFQNTDPSSSTRLLTTSFRKLTLLLDYYELLVAVNLVSED